MKAADLDAMEAHALLVLSAQDGDRHRKLVRQMAERWPDRPALGFCFALTSAAARIEDNFSGAQLGYKLAALVAADVFALEAMGHCPAVGRDLLHFWRRVDPYFLRG